MPIDVQVLRRIVKAADEVVPAIKLANLSERVSPEVDVSAFVDHLMFLVNYGCLRMQVRGGHSLVQVTPEANAKLNALPDAKTAADVSKAGAR